MEFIKVLSRGYMKFIGKSKFTKKEINALKYKWEFLRRNIDYQKDYKVIIKKKLNVSFSDFAKKVRSADKDFLGNLEVVRLLTKWDVLYPLDPSVTFNGYLKKKKGKDLNLFYFILQGGHEAVSTNIDPKPIKDDMEVLIHVPVVKISVNMALPKEKILDEFELVVDEWKARFNKAKKKLGMTDEPRLQYQQYDQYLKIYDDSLKKIPIEKIGQKYFGGYEKYYATRKAKRCIESCEKMIDDGFRQIG